MSAKKNHKPRLADDANSRFLSAVSTRPVMDDRGNVLVPKKWIRLVDSPACVVMIYKVWAGTGYGAKQTKVIHRWPVKSVLRRAGLRWD